MTRQTINSAPGRESPFYARAILSMAVAPTQATLFGTSEEEHGASQAFRARALSTVEPLLAEAAKSLSEALDSTVSVDLRHRIEGDTSLIQIVAISGAVLEQATLQKLWVAGVAMAERLTAAMAAVGSPLAFTRSAASQADRLFDQVAEIKKRGVPTAFSCAVATGYVSDLGALRFTEVHKRAKSTWLQDPEPTTSWLEVIIRSSRIGKQLSAAPLNGTPTFQVDTDAEDELDSDLAARAHALCGGGSCWIKVRRSTETCKEAPELVRHVHHLLDVEIRDASQLDHLLRLHSAAAGLIELAKVFGHAGSQKANRKRPQVPPPGLHSAA